MNKIMYTLCRFFLWGSCLLAASCGVDKQPFETSDLGSPEVQIDAFSDSTYFSQVYYMLENEGDLYVSDSKRGQVFRLGAADLKLKRTFGRSGQGPQELIWCSNFGISHDTLMVYDFTGDRVQMYDKNTGRYIGGISWLKKNLGVNAGSRAPFVNGRMIFCSTRPGGAMMAIDVKDTARHMLFGEKYKFDTEVQDMLRNSRYIVESDRYIISVSDNVPVVEKYAKDGKQEETYNLSEVGIIKEVLDANAAKPVIANGYYKFAKDVYLDGDKLYILVNHWDESDERPKPAFQVVELDVASTIKPIKAYKLPYGVAYETIAADSKYLYVANNKNCVIQKFKK